MQGEERGGVSDIAAAKLAHSGKMQRGAAAATITISSNTKRATLHSSYLGGVQKAAIGIDELGTAGTILHVLNAGTLHRIALVKNMRHNGVNGCCGR